MTYHVYIADRGHSANTESRKSPSADCSMNPDEPPSKWQTAKLKPRLEVYTGSAQNYPAIKEFLELDPNFEAPQVKSGKKQILLII